MPAKVTLTIIKGKLPGRQYIFDSRTSSIIGRAEDCNIQLPNDKDHSTISRYHCLLDINPPNIRIRDFGSKNGTYINGKKIGQRQENQTPEEAAKDDFPEFDLKDNDEIKLSNTVFVVSIEGKPEEIKINNFSPGTIDFNNRVIEEPNLLGYIQKFLKLAKAGNNKLLAIKGYDIIQLLGKGGFGEVYLAQHNNSKKFIALKVMLPQVAANEYAVDSFLRETENIKVLRHPNVVNLIDYGYSDGIFFFTMEYCQHGTVKDLIGKHGGQLPVDVALPIILQVLDGLEYTHNVEIPYVKLNDGNFSKSKGLVHRDLKPANIFLTEVGDEIIVKIGDYGLSKAFDLAGLSGQTLTGSKAYGTPFFISREQALHFRDSKPEVDIWAAAASLYYMLTGYYPRDFLGNEIYLEVLTNKPVPILKRDTNIPHKLAEVIDLALIEKPEVTEIYFKSAKEFKQALLTVL